ncbi:hypothetical protein HDU92_008022 [Lobulomyces angularis]|nr:hypothetical protein HDU92_008022 [Lobulomyces angularis]
MFHKVVKTRSNYIPKPTPGHDNLNNENVKFTNHSISSHNRRYPPLGPSSRVRSSQLQKPNKQGDNLPKLPQRLLLQNKKPRKNEFNFELEQKLNFGNTQKAKSFKELNVDSKIIETLNTLMKYNKPTEVQASAIGLVNEGHDVLIASETGGGKTLAYLIPLIQQLREEENKLMENLDFDLDLPNPLGELRKIKRPRAVIIVPSRELVKQVTTTAKVFSHFSKLRIVGIDSSMKKKQIELKLEEPVDILVTSCGSLLKMMGYDKKTGETIEKTKIYEKFNAKIKSIKTKSVELKLSHCTRVIVDEADSMFDEGFGDELKWIINPLLERREAEKKGGKGRPCQFVFATATLPRQLSQYFNFKFPDLKRVETKLLHKTNPNIKQYFLRVAGNTTKENMLIDIIRRGFISDDVKKVLVFCNTQVSVKKIGHLLREKGFNSEILLSDDVMKERNRKILNFVEVLKLPNTNIDVNKEKIVKDNNENAETNIDTDSEELNSVEDKENFLKSTNILVATDLASRGLNTTKVDHVILYDFPTTAIDYIHRVGRTGRIGRKGVVTSIIAGRDFALADSIKNAIRKKLPLA